jgi:hypothetical protein
MHSQYNSILKVEVFHSYYESQICNDLIFTPQQDTHKILNRFGFVFNKFGNGFRLLNSKTKFAELATYITNNTGCKSLEFYANAQEENFGLFTDLPVDKLGITSYNSSNTLGENFKGAQILKPIFNEQNQTSQLIKLEIELDDLGDNEAHYCIQFEARKTRWNYYIINQDKKLFQDLAIKCKGQNQVSFINQGNRILKNGVTATLFTSEDENLSISNYTKYKLDLVNVKKTSNSNTKNITVFEGLPVPRPENIQINHESNTELISSMMYVYV